MARRIPLTSLLWDAYIIQTRKQNQEDTRNRLAAQGRRSAWRRYHRAKTIETALPLVARLARDVKRLFAPHLDMRDLQQAGAVGLLKAAATYDPALGKFEAYAYFRIRGAIIDSQKRRTYREESCVSLEAITTNGWVPRQIGVDDAPLADEEGASSMTESERPRLVPVFSPRF
jgi:RNA polymerase sigma factor (sigma-70 family)